MARSAESTKRPGFFQKFLELQLVMLTQNAGLTGAHPFQSSPFTWPVLTRGISFWVDDEQKNRQIYLLGNPLIWWSGLFAVALIASLMLVDQLALRRGVDDMDGSKFRKILMHSDKYYRLEML
jgi:dolichyl-phosphate-mannose-protein mannosyltransferase